MFWLSSALALAPAAIDNTDRNTPLFASVMLVQTKASSETVTCEAALDALIAKAMEAGAKSGHTEVLGIYAQDLSAAPLDAIPCKQTGIPDAPSGAVVNGAVLLARPGEGFPSTSTHRQAQLAGLLSAVHQAPLDELSLVLEDGKIWVDAGIRDHEDILPVDQGLNARAVKMLQQHVIPWVSRWAPLATQVPEVAGAILSVDVKSVAEKGKRKERFRYEVEASPAAAFTIGQLAEPDWTASLVVTVDANPKKPNPQRVNLDVMGAAGSVTAGGDRSIEGDIDDLEDE